MGGYPNNLFKSYLVPSQIFICKRGWELHREAPLGLTCWDYWGRVRSLKTSRLRSGPHWQRCPSHSSAGLWSACQRVISLIRASKSLSGQDTLCICNKSTLQLYGIPTGHDFVFGWQCLSVLLGWILSEPEASLEDLGGGGWRQRPSRPQSATASTTDSWPHPWHVFIISPTFHFITGKIHILTEDKMRTSEPGSLHADRIDGKYVGCVPAQHTSL